MGPTVVVDNGGCSCRVGWANEDSPSIVSLNATAQQRGNLDVFVADQIGRIKNQGTLSFTRPCDRGIVTNWQCQTDVWKRLLPQVMKNEPYHNTALMITYAPFTPDVLTSNLDEIVFEEFGFDALQRIPAPVASSCLYHHYSDTGKLGSLCQLNDCESDGFGIGGNLCCMVIDIGYSATYAIPCIKGRAIQSAVKRLNIGGKMMTTLLQELLSYRQYNMMDETVLVNDAKEKLCYVAQQGLEHEISRSVGSTIPASRSAYKEFVLPTYHGGDDRGHVRSLKVDEMTGRLRRTRKGDESKGQCLRFESERFTVPEILFHPSDVGLEQGGVHELIKESISATDPALHALFYSNILLTGGVCQLPNLLPRLYAELRPLVPRHFQLNIKLAENSSNDAVDPDVGSFAWKGAALIARNQALLGTTKLSKSVKKSKASGLNSDVLSGPADSKSLTIKDCGDIPLPNRSQYAYVPIISKAEYLEMGPDYCNEKFRFW